VNVIAILTCAVDRLRLLIPRDDHDARELHEVAFAHGPRTQGKVFQCVTGRFEFCFVLRRITERAIDIGLQVLNRIAQSVCGVSPPECAASPYSVDPHHWSPRACSAPHCCLSVCRWAGTSTTGKPNSPAGESGATMGAMVEPKVMFRPHTNPSSPRAVRTL
jgi:hypothetical protein